jgi:surfeit locus 1 family protein
MINGASRRATGMRRVWAAAAALMCVGFLALGGWQVQRLQWKQDLIARVEARVHAAPVALPATARWTELTAQADEYRHLRASGVWLAQHTTRVQASTALGSGFWLLVPLCQKDGTMVLVNRGFVPARQGDFAPVAAPRAAADVCPIDPSRAAQATVTGLLRLTEPRGSVLQKNEPASSRWFSRDVAAIAAAHGLSPVAPYFIDADAAPAASSMAPAASPGVPAASAPGAGDEPVGGLTVIAFHNSHLVYALTWFALALMAAGACRLILRERDTHHHESTT